MSEPLNFHAIVGPNGMCSCGVEADGTVVTCGGLLEELIQERLAALSAPPVGDVERLIATLGPFLKHGVGCRLGKVVEPVACPSCGEKMIRVRNASGYLNDDQFDAVKAGDWFCKRHEDIRYVWEHKLPKQDCTCGLEAALAGRGRPRPPQEPKSGSVSGAAAAAWSRGGLRRAK